MIKTSKIALKITDKFSDYRDDVCSICKKECNQHTRVCYESFECVDKYSNPLIVGEFSVCKECSKMFLNGGKE